MVVACKVQKLLWAFIWNLESM